MNLSRHANSTALRAVTPQVAASLAFMVFVAVAGTNPAFATIDNTAAAAGTYNGNPIVSNTASVSVDVSNALSTLEVTKVATPNTNVPAGTLVTYTYTVRNSGNQTLTNVSLNDVHSPEVLAAPRQPNTGAMREMRTLKHRCVFARASGPMAKNTS